MSIFLYKIYDLVLLGKESHLMVFYVSSFSNLCSGKQLVLSLLIYSVLRSYLRFSITHFQVSFERMDQSFLEGKVFFLGINNFSFFSHCNNIPLDRL